MTGLGRPRLHLRETGSTSDVARELASAGAPHGALVTAAAQSAGRGRQGRAWSAPPGRSLLMTLVLRDLVDLLPLRAAVAVAAVCGDGAQIKWPNDVLIDRRKVAGILAEGRPQEGWAVLGIGINVALRVEDLPPELHATAATLGREPAAVEDVLGELLVALEETLAAPAGDVLARYRARDALRGRPITWGAGQGIADGIDEDGRLVVVRGDGTRVALGAGEVHLGTEQAR